MSYFSELEQACPNVQAALDDLWISGRFPGVTERMPLAEYLTSPANRAGIVSEILPGSGKTRTAEVTYRRRGLVSDAQSNVANPTCDATGYIGNEKQTYSIDTSVNKATPGEAIPINSFDESCPPNAQTFAEKLAWHVELMDRIMATEIATQVALLTGNWGASVTTNAGVFEVATLRPTTTEIDPRAWIKIQNALDDSGFPSLTPLFGGATMREYMQSSIIGCCANEGLDVAAALNTYGRAYAYDKYLTDALGDTDKWLAIAPRALQVLNWTGAPRLAAMGQVWGLGANYLYTTIASPRLGLAYDVMAKDDCGTLKLNLISTVKVIGLPTDLYATGDEYEGVTLVAEGEVVNA